jgi:hypothetical protein
LIDLRSEEEVAELTISVQLDRIGRRSRETESFDGITEWLAWFPIAPPSRSAPQMAAPVLRTAMQNMSPPSSSSGRLPT